MDRGNLPHPERYRVVDLGDLRRIRAPFRIGQDEIGNGSEVHLSSLAETAETYLDGNVYYGTTQLVPSAKSPYTGTRWQLRLHGDGTWSVLNQGQEDQMLSGASGMVGLGRETASTLQSRFDSTRWLLYRDRTGFRLRPGTAGWLAVDSGRVVLRLPDAESDRTLYWKITPAE
jgi:hypothetical protein